MNKQWALFLVLGFGAAAMNVEAAPPVGSTPQVKYKEGKTVRFDSLEIQGALQRPETLIVTGDIQDKGRGLLRLRSHFLDRQAMELGLSASEGIQKAQSVSRAEEQNGGSP